MKARKELEPLSLPRYAHNGHHHKGNRMKRFIFIPLIHFLFFGSAFSQITVHSPSTKDSVKSCSSYADEVLYDAWDMNERTDLGWRIFNTIELPLSYLEDISFQNGIFSAKSAYTSGYDPDFSDVNITILDSAYIGTSMLGKTGANFPINADKYTTLALRMYLGPDIEGKLGQFIWSKDTIYYGVSTSGTFSTHNGWFMYMIDIPSLGIVAGDEQWEGFIDSLRMDPLYKKDKTIKIDWMRLVEYDSDCLRKITWSGNKGNVDIYLDDDDNAKNGNLGLLAKNVSGTSYAFLAGALMPGDYYVVITSAGTSLSLESPDFSYSPGYFHINDIPILKITKPSAEGSDTDYMTLTFGDPWDMSNPEDVDYTVNVKNPEFTYIDYEDHPGNLFTNQSVYLADSEPAVPPLVGDPHIFFFHFHYRAIDHSIDANKYHNLVFKMGIDGAQSYADGSHARVVYKNKTEATENVSEDIIIRHLPDKWVMTKIVCDLKTLPLEPGAGSPSHIGWTGYQDGFRIDPHEFSEPRKFVFDDIKLTSDWIADTKFTAEWKVSDSESSLLVSLYYDDDNSGYDGTLLAENVSIAPGAGSYTVDVSSITVEKYWLYAIIDDGVNQNRCYAGGPIVNASSFTYTISGTVTAGGSGLEGVTITFSDGEGTATTDSSGNYSQTVSYGWSSTATPSKDGYTFSPEDRSYTNVTLDQTNQDYTANLIIPPEISLSTSSLNLSSTSSGIHTSDQQFRITNTGGGTLDWSITDNLAWLSCTPESGTGVAVITVSVDPSDIAVGTYNATISVSSNNATNSPQTISVTFNVYGKGTSSGPIGVFATPTEGATVSSSIPVTGWALDDIEVESVKIYREEGGSLVYIGDAVFVEGARADVEQAYPGYPNNYKAGWGYMMLTNFLPNGGNGTFTIYAVATDKEGNEVTLGASTITVDNANAVKPFGAIDTPTQGGTASGSSFVNFGWVLTPMPNSIPTDGSTIDVYVDGVNLGHPTYNQYRPDVAALFPGYANSDGAVGYFYLDTTAYDNGVHTIFWTAEDSAGNTDGIGSRYFIANTGSSVSARMQGRSQRKALDIPLSFESVMNLPVSFEPIRYKRGFKTDIEPEIVEADNYGLSIIEIREVERIEIDLGEGTGYKGYLIVSDQLRPLPIGSTLDIERGIFLWMPGPGFLGQYDLVFIIEDKYGVQRKAIVRIKILPKFSQSEFVLNEYLSEILSVITYSF